MEEKLAKEESELDILSTFIPKEKDIGSMNEEELEKLRADILEDMKQRLVERANLIQSRYDKVYCSNTNYFSNMVNNDNG